MRRSLLFLSLPALTVLLATACASGEPTAPSPEQTASACDAVEPASDRALCRQSKADAVRDNRLIYESGARNLPPDLCDQASNGCVIRPTAGECALYPERCKTRPTEPL